jgi:mRNA-degrading endonuclease RelE of RelBE toxin-antitoxin system
MPDEEYRALQLALVLRPEQGALIPGGSGLRKVRWGGKGRGKRGGFRVIYYWELKSETIYMLYLYSKNEQSDLTPVQAKALGQLVRKELR